MSHLSSAASFISIPLPVFPSRLPSFPKDNNKWMTSSLQQHKEVRYLLGDFLGISFATLNFSISLDSRSDSCCINSSLSLNERESHKYIYNEREVLNATEIFANHNEYSWFSFIRLTNSRIRQKTMGSSLLEVQIYRVKFLFFATAKSGSIIVNSVCRQKLKHFSSAIRPKTDSGLLHRCCLDQALTRKAQPGSPCWTERVCCIQKEVKLNYHVSFPDISSLSHKIRWPSYFHKIRLSSKWLVGRIRCDSYGLRSTDHLEGFTDQESQKRNLGVPWLRFKENYIIWKNLLSTKQGSPTDSRVAFFLFHVIGESCDCFGTRKFQNSWAWYFFRDIFISWKKCRTHNVLPIFIIVKSSDIVVKGWREILHNAVNERPGSSR